LIQPELFSANFGHQQALHEAKIHHDAGAYPGPNAARE